MNTISVTSTTITSQLQMPPDQPHTNGKRKASDASENPLLNLATASKKAKKDSVRDIISTVTFD
jgi:hypothetical protein